MEGKTCDGNCIGCSFQQQAYCSAQRTYALLKNEEALFSHINNLEEAITAMKVAFERFGNPKEAIINPFEMKAEVVAVAEEVAEEEESEAQEGGGAENRSPEE